tara:strand:- start:239 stop:541 length:303 start_codon:yes stop_codon:yes gene_type:complete
MVKKIGGGPLKWISYDKMTDSVEKTAPTMLENVKYLMGLAGMGVLGLALFVLFIVVVEFFTGNGTFLKLIMDFLKGLLPGNKNEDFKGCEKKDEDKWAKY